VQQLAAKELTAIPVEAPAPKTDDTPWHDSALSLDERLSMAEGRPTADRLMAAMAQLDCGACGYVCRTYSQAIASGAEKNLTLCSPGGAPTAKAIKRILKESKEPPRDGASSPGLTRALSADDGAVPSSSTAGAALVRYSRQNPFPAKVLESLRLNGEGSQKETRHVRLDLAGSGLSYQVGDALGVYPTNCDALVGQIINLLGATGQEVVRTPGGTDAAFFSALRTANLKDVPDELMELLFKLATAPEDRRRLRTLGENEHFLATMDVLDALQIAPSSRPSPQALIELLSPLAPRLYSIASSPAAHGSEVHLTVGKVFYEKNGRLRKGVASTMLAERVSSGESLPVFLHASHGFTLPENPAAPIVMVGPGTGIAPFRGFLHERKAIGGGGRNWLFFGDQREACDFLYRDELEQFQREGVLTRLDTAFSRDGAEKVYVQHRMRQHGEELFRWLEDGAHFYVCGDASRMAKDVDQALHEVIQQHGRRSKDEAKDYVTTMTKERRYLRDVY
jgi:sulfite reductase (NADPH) flavoprotein alpha-component